MRLVRRRGICVFQVQFLQNRVAEFGSYSFTVADSASRRARLCALAPARSPTRRATRDGSSVSDGIARLLLLSGRIRLERWRTSRDATRTTDAERKRRPFRVSLRKSACLLPLAKTELQLPQSHQLHLQLLHRLLPNLLSHLRPVTAILPLETVSARFPGSPSLPTPPGSPLARRPAASLPNPQDRRRNGDGEATSNAATNPRTRRLDESAWSSRQSRSSERRLRSVERQQRAWIREAS